MEMVLIFTFCLILADTDAVTTVTGYRGRSVQIKCSYTSGYEDYNKYLCRGECSTWPGSKDIPVDSKSPAKDSRFSLYDDTTAKVFTVTITDLRPEDGGTYWCVIERAVSDIYTEIRLLVKLDVPVISTVTHTKHSTSTQAMSTSVHTENTHSTTAFPDTPGYIMICTGAVLLAIAVILAIYCIIKCRGSETVTQSPRETNGNDQHSLPLQSREKDNPPESVYQSLDAATNQSDSVYQSLTLTNSQSDSVYHSLSLSNIATSNIYQ